MKKLILHIDLTQIENNFERIKLSKKELNYLAQGGTAVGSGINAPKNFDKVFCKFLNKFTINNYKPAKNKFEAIASHDSLVNFSNISLKLTDESKFFKVKN